MKPLRLLFYLLAGLLTTSGPALSDTPVVSETPEMYECPQADGTPLYTNRERPGCHAKALRPLSSVPEFVGVPYEPRMPASIAQRYDLPPPADWYGNNQPTGASQNVPDWGKDWHARNTDSGTVQGEICAMYAEWLNLNERSRGGFFFGSDPSYGGDPAGRNLRSPSYSFYDNARWLTLSRYFGSGFVPIGCP